MRVSSPSRSIIVTVAVATATAGGLGYAPLAPGTFGAAAGVAIFVALTAMGAGVGITCAVALALLVLGARASSMAEVHFERHDDGRIVIDEVVGQLIALLPILALAPGRVLDPPLLLLGFLAFRLFDIWKPGPVKLAERHFEAGWGVMLDDVVAGLLAAGVVATLLFSGVLP